MLTFITIILSCSKERSNGQTNVDIQPNRLSHVRTIEEAKELAISAMAMLDTETKVSSRTIVSSQAVVNTVTKGSEEETDTLFYVFNFDGDAGFSIINADLQEDPFICITESGNYTDGIPTGVDPFDAYIIQLKQKLQDLSRTRGEPVDPPTPIDTTGLYSYIVNRYDGSYMNPLINTKWGKDGIYGAYCPNGAAGCVARAIGQIMVYHGHPSSITLGQQTGPYVSGTTLLMHWYFIEQHILNHTGTQTCSSYHTEISALLYDISETVDMTYFNNGTSGASASMIQPGLLHYGYYLDPLTTAVVDDIVASIDAYRPVILTGQTAGGDGHAWIADGYKDYVLYQDTYAQAYPAPGYYLVNSVQIDERHALHFNWGWDGECNGYFNFGIYNSGNPDSYDGSTNTYNEIYTTVKMHTNIRKNI